MANCAGTLGKDAALFGVAWQAQVLAKFGASETSSAGAGCFPEAVHIQVWGGLDGEGFRRA